jgi:DNA segregation ATPase FtsK/SpoIIIE-like protein
VAVNDPNWKAPSLELLEKKQSPADAGDVQQNAQTIKDTLNEFNIDVEMEGANIGPKGDAVYASKPPSGVKLTRITALETNIALNLAAQSLCVSRLQYLVSVLSESKCQTEKLPTCDCTEFCNGQTMENGASNR